MGRWSPRDVPSVGRGIPQKDVILVAEGLQKREGRHKDQQADGRGLKTKAQRETLDTSALGFFVDGGGTQGGVREVGGHFRTAGGMRVTGETTFP